MGMKVKEIVAKLVELGKDIELDDLIDLLDNIGIEDATEDTDIDKYGGIPWFATIQFKTAVITTIVITIGAFTFLFINNKKKKKKSTDPESDSFYEE